jgi:arylsulfatase A-like enzyme
VKYRITRDSSRQPSTAFMSVMSKNTGRALGFSMLSIVASCTVASDSNDEHSAPPPNILLIVADDLGYTDLGAYGGEIKTPNLDQLAYRGIRLTNFHTGPSCAPSRAMLLTGTDNHLAGMGSQGTLHSETQKKSPAYQNRIRADVPTVAEHLSKLGYRTMASAKWHVGSEPDALPNARGFDNSFVLTQGGGGHFDDTPMFESHKKANWLEDDQAVQLPENFYSSDYMTDKVLSFIDDTPSGQPFFAYLGYTAPHWPLQAPASSIEKYRGKYDEGWDVLRAQRMSGAIRAGVVAQHAKAVEFEFGMRPWKGLSEDDQAVARAKMETYAAMVDRVDENIGRLISALERSGQLQNTLIVFLADNGAEAHEMELYSTNPTWIPANFDNSVPSIGTRKSYTTLGPSWARATAAPFRGSKSKVSEGGIRVPAFVRLPNSDSAGSIDSTYFRIMDLAPTFIDLAGGEKPPAMMGRSLLTRWKGGASPYLPGEAIAFETFGRRGVQKDHWKLLLQEAPYGTGQWQLYNLSNDPGEQHDLATEFPEVRNSLIDDWQSYAEHVGVVLPDGPVSY